MSIRVQQPTPDQLVVIQGKEAAAMLLGVGIALPGVYLYYQLGAALYEYSAALSQSDAAMLGALVSILPGLLITLLIGAGFLVPGLFMFATKTMILDRRTQTITQVQKVGPYRRQKVHSATAFTLVEIDFAAPKEKQRKLELFDVQVSKAAGVGLHIATVTAHEVDVGLALTRQIAEFLGYQYQSRIDHWLTKPIYLTQEEI